MSVNLDQISRTAVIEIFEALPAEEQNPLFGAVWEKDGKPMGDPEYGRKHVFDDIAFLFQNLSEATQRKIALKTITPYGIELPAETAKTMTIAQLIGLIPSDLDRKREEHFPNEFSLNLERPGFFPAQDTNFYLSGTCSRHLPSIGVYRNYETHPHLDFPYYLEGRNRGVITLRPSYRKNLPEDLQRAIAHCKDIDIHIRFDNTARLKQELKKQNEDDAYRKDSEKGKPVKHADLPINLVFHGVAFPDLTPPDEGQADFPFGIFGANGANWFGGWGGAPFGELQPTNVHAHKVDDEHQINGCSPNNARLWIEDEASFYSVFIKDGKAIVVLHVCHTEHERIFSENPELTLGEFPAHYVSDKFDNLRALIRGE